MLCGSGFNGRFFKTQPSHIRVKFADISLSNGSTIHSLLVGPSDNLVVNIGEVPDKGDIVSTISKITINGIEDDCGASMANMTEVIDRYPTDIHPHLFPIKRDEIFFFASQSIVDTNRHKSILKRNNGIMEWWNDDVMKT